MRVLITVMLMVTWYGLSRVDGPPIASGLARLALLASAVILWIDEHWLDFDIRIVVPGLLLFLLDQALMRDFQENYGDYPQAAILSIGVAWFAGTLLCAVILSRLCKPTADATDNA